MPIVRVLGRRRTSSGAWGEEQATRHLRRQGLHILKRNFRVRRGEIDIVALDGRILVFVEVKTFLPTSRARGADRVTTEKKKRIRRAARAYIARKRPEVDGWRADVMTVEYEEKSTHRRKVREIRWFRAFFQID